MEKISKKVNKFPFLYNNFDKFIRETKEELGKISHIFGKKEFHNLSGKRSKINKQFRFLWNNFQKFIKEIKKLAKIFIFLE